MKTIFWKAVEYSSENVHSQKQGGSGGAFPDSLVVRTPSAFTVKISISGQGTKIPQGLVATAKNKTN